MTAPHHDSAAWLEVVHRPARYWRVYERGQPRNGIAPAGWWVRRICPCHDGELVSIRFETEAEAERCLRVLDEDCRRRNAAQPPMTSSAACASGEPSAPIMP